jgi:hypothetical protein
LTDNYAPQRPMRPKALTNEPIFCDRVNVAFTSAAKN